MCGTSAAAAMSSGIARTTTGAFELVCRIAGATIEFPPGSKTNASGYASSAASITDTRPTVQPVVTIMWRCCAANTIAERVAAARNDRPRRKCPKTKPRWMTSSVMPFTNTTPTRRYSHSGRSAIDTPRVPGERRQECPHRQANQHSDYEGRRSCSDESDRAQCFPENRAEEQPLRDQNGTDAPNR